MKTYKLLVIYFLFCSSFFSTYHLFAQDDLEAALNSTEAGKEKKKEYTSAAFKSTRLINLHNTERLAKGALEYRICHRFGTLNSGAYQFWGLDQAEIRMGFEYGLSDWIHLGVGRSSYQKTYDAFVKAAILRQSNLLPISLVYMGSIAVNTLREVSPDFNGRLAYVNQLIIGSKLNQRISMVLAPTFVHRNLVTEVNDAVSTVALGIGGRFKITKRFTFNAEYIWRMPPEKKSLAFDNYKDAFSIGFDIETGGHVFQLTLSNSRGMFDKAYLVETVGSWGKGDIHFGFNLIRNFTVGGKKKKE
ncbi:MAG: DUF5777 family beta-barrel protein [Thermoflexibacter sp.]|jgi:hypothetical protein|nr:DUF5777 family beta-barrel protein [Thermoflexibacter sp.]